MDDLLSGIENLKVSAFSKLSTFTGDINNVTIGPNSILLNTFATSTRDESCVKVKKKDTPPKHNKLKLPLHHLLKEYETLRKGRVEEASTVHYNKFEKFTKWQNETKRNEWLTRQREFIGNMVETENVILQMLDQPDNEYSKRNEKLEKRYQDMLQKKIECEKQVERQKESQRIFNENIEKIWKSQVEFAKTYREVYAIISNCMQSDQMKSALGESFKLLKSLQESFDEIVNKCKTFSVDYVDEAQQTRAVEILNQLKDLKKHIEVMVDGINTKKQEEAAKALLEQQKQNKIKEGKSKMSTIEQCVSVTNLKKYVEVKQFLEQYTQSFKELETNPQLKQFRFDCKKAVNIPVNAISAMSPEHLKDKYVKLSNLLSGKTIVVADRQIDASRNPLGVAFCMDLLAKKIVLQGDLTISSNPEAAFAYATIIVSLWNEYPDFGKLLLGYFYTQCPYVVPFYIPKTEGQSNQDHYTALGYHYYDGQIEKQDKFLKRMTGLFRLYFAILIAKPRRNQRRNPHNIQNAWIFLASILKLDPLLDITATAIHTFLETIGYEMEAVYGTAFRKTVRIIATMFMPRLKKVDSGGPVARLEVLLQDYAKTGHFEKPHGLLPPNFW